MTSRYVFHLPQHYNLRGFERELAYLELQTLVGSQVEKSNCSFTLYTDSKIDPALLRRLTFIERVEVVNGTEIEVIEPLQVNVDRTAAADKAVVSNNLDLLPSLQVKRRTHNYLTHSLHQYKGKFYPQIAKSLINYAGLDPGSVVLDPFCGSGTTLVECLLNGYRGLGVDLNPLAVLVTRAKVETLLLDARELESEVNALINRVQQQFRQAKLWDQGIDDLIWTFKEIEPSISLDHIQVPNKEYLITWFEPAALAKLVFICGEIERVPDERIQNFAKVVLSDIVRDYSLQVPDQLRVRRRKTPPDHTDLLLKYRAKLRKHTQSAYRAAVLGLHERQDVPPVEVFQADVTKLNRSLSEYFRHDGRVDAIITSPPYATALPYIDTDRLSLFFLDLIKKNERKNLEWNMIGNREITQGKRQELEEEFLNSYGTAPLPTAVKALIGEVLERNAQANVGFRRKNKASLLYKYFKAMREAFIQFHRVLKPGGSCAVIIGNNKTTAGGKLIEIPTDDFLIEIGENVGFRLVKRLPMTDQAAYMAHSKNVIDTETIFVLKRT